MVDVAAPTMAFPTRQVFVVGDLFADRYEVLSALGSGGMGDVYAVMDHEIGEEVALKVLHPHIAEAPGALDRFRREVKLARRVTHPNVARTFDLGTAKTPVGHLRFLTMERLDGAPLPSVEDGKRFPLPEILRLLTEIARGLAAAHAVGVAHRDLKPDNVLVGLRDGRVVITDFGIARLVESETARATLASMATMAPVGAEPTAVLVGTPAYMAPEQIEGKELDGRADVYALGVVAFELLTGEAPIAEHSFYALAAARLGRPPRDPRTIEPGIPESIAQLVIDMMAVHRDDRPDAQQVLARLGAIRGLASVDAIGRADTPSPSRRPAAVVDFGLIAQPAQPRTVAIVPFDVVDHGLRSLATVLSLACADVLSKSRLLRVIAPGTVQASAESHRREGVVDPIALARALSADLIIDGSVRGAGERLRVRLRVLDHAKGTQLWAERFEGSPDGLLELERAVTAGAENALRARSSETMEGRRPTDDDARKALERAAVLYRQFSPSCVREAGTILEEALVRFPEEPHLMSLLGAVLSRQFLQSGASDRALVARAEEVSLRALAADPTMGEAYSTIGVLRLAQGELRAAVRAFQDAVARSPLIAESHAALGRLLAESLHLDEGLRRIDLAIRLDPNSINAYIERARTHALTGDRVRADEDLAKAAAIGGEASIAIAHMRLAVWFDDRPMAARCADLLEKNRAGAAWDKAVPLLRSVAAGTYWEHAVPAFRAMADGARNAPRHRATMLQLAAEYFASSGKVEETLVALEEAAQLPLVDLLWLDRCPVFATLRELPRFARVRAQVSARAAQLWGSA